jgi:hypothetical protein
MKMSVPITSGSAPAPSQLSRQNYSAKLAEQINQSMVRFHSWMTLHPDGMTGKNMRASDL